MIKLNLNENFICRIWEEQSYYSGLKTTYNDKVEVLDYGKRNYDAGPDYKDTKLRIGEAVYSGSIEIHRTLNDWYLHNHENDNKYNDLILHVVFYGDDHSSNVKVKKSRTIPTVILSEFLSGSIHDIWKEIINNPSPVFRLPCFPQGKEVPAEIKNVWIEKLSLERLHYKSQRMNSRLEELTDDHSKKIFWDQILFEFICEALGYSKNKEQFLKLAKNVNVKEIKKLDLGRDQMESVLFGMAGFLYDLKFRDDYINETKSSWNNLRDVLRKEIMKKSEWNFFRLRPANFPTVRLAYASGILNELIQKDFFKSIVNIFESSDKVMDELVKLFSGIRVSDYWKAHYNFGRISSSEYKSIGKQRITDIVSNILIPIIYLYSAKFEKAALKKRTEYFYKTVKHKNSLNEITRVMKSQLDTGVVSMADEQGLIQLHNFYCVKGKCKDCEIGQNVFEEKIDPLKIILY